MSLKPFREIPKDVLEWARWMKDQTIMNTGDTISESQITDLGSYVTTELVKSGTGTPEGNVTGSPGHLYQRLDGGALTSLYVKESGVNTDTGWVAK